MALSQNEQRMLAEIERRLAADDPGLASCLARFRRPGAGTVLRSPRARIIGSLFTVLLVAMVSLMVYAMIPFRTHTIRHTPPPTAGAPANTAGAPATTAGAPATTAISVATSDQPNQARQTSASAGQGAATAGQGAANRSAAPTAAGTTRQAEVKPTSVEMLPQASP